MKGFTIRVSGQWGHFRRPETNNNPMTHDFITKTAFVGLIGAVLGIERSTMLPLFPQLCEDLLYGVSLNRPIRKVSWAFTMRPIDKEIGPKQMELLKHPDFTVAIALQNERSLDIFDRFFQSTLQSEACYTPVLGLHNCPAELGLPEENLVHRSNGKFECQGFVRREIRIARKWDGQKPFQLSFERLPTYQKEFWNLPDRYIEVVYPAAGQSESFEGEHFQFSRGEKWCLI